MSSNDPTSPATDNNVPFPEDPHEPMNFVAVQDDPGPHSAFILAFAVDQCMGFGMIDGDGKPFVTTRPWLATVFASADLAEAAGAALFNKDTYDVCPLTDVAAFRASHDSWDCDLFEHNQNDPDV